MKLSRLQAARAPLSDVLELAGLACLDATAWWLHPIAGLGVAGAMLLGIGWVIGR